MNALSLLVSFLVAALDPCAPVDPAERQDVSEAREYRAVGDLERDAGRLDSAVVAYRGALERDPSDHRSRSALAALCEEKRKAGPLERGLGLMREGDCASALPVLDRARREGQRAAALLLGICLQQLGEDEQSKGPLLEAEQDPSTSDSARFFLGLIALREGRGSEAEELFDASAADRRLAPFARELSRVARRRGRLVLSALVEGGWDSNADLAPDGSVAATGSADGMAGAAASLSFAPQGDRGPFARVSLAWREQLRFGAFDARGVNGALGWRVGRGGRRAMAEYGYDYLHLGQGPYLSAHRLAVAGAIDLTSIWSARATYAIRHESYLDSMYGDYSGFRHAAAVSGIARPGRRWELTAAWRLGRASAAADVFSWWEHGPELSVRTALASRVRVALETDWTWRGHDRADPVFVLSRADSYLDGSIQLDYDVGACWTLRFEVAARRATSNIADFQYGRFVSSVGLSYSRGLL